ncbi:excinuclease ABC subunit B [Candidatus Hakubella thermalkaliphila]|nr:excinuclease ABC subunit B [Candidatus Hakubella thermalkaliphila]
MGEFKLIAPFEPQGDQPQATAKLWEGLNKGYKYQTLLGVTGSGKTYSMAVVIEGYQKPTLVMAPNKILAAQLCNEFKEFFPGNAVEYFVSYYDYYQPEAYIPQTDTYIEKDSSINAEIEKLRYSATDALFSRNDVIIVASVSCIYSLGSPEEYKGQRVVLEVGRSYDRQELFSSLVKVQYERNEIDFSRGKFRAKGDTVDIFPAYRDTAIRVDFWGDEVDRILEIDPLTGEVLGSMDSVLISPATHFLTAEDSLEAAIHDIEVELEERLQELKSQDKLLEAQRLEMRTRYDLEMLREVGFCQGIENYSRHLTRRKPGETPHTLLDYFPDEFLVFIDESHISVPQINGMYRGDRSRKETLVEYGFRLPSALDNRPLRFDEFEKKIAHAIFVSATPSPYERKVSSQIVEQIIRPTGLIDPEVMVRPTRGQIDDLYDEIKKRVKNNERVLITTLTKRMAEDLCEYLLDLGLKVRYMHSEIDTVERIEIIRGLRSGEFDVLVGINLLREGLDLPEVSLVAILDADKVGYLRSESSLIQTIGRAARNINGQVIMYADTITEPMRQAISETNRRRMIQTRFNVEHGIEPKSIYKKVSDILTATRVGEGGARYEARPTGVSRRPDISEKDLPGLIQALEEEMRIAAEELRFEYAARIRDEIREIKEQFGTGARR